MDRRLGRLVERADALAQRADRLVASALRSVRGEMALLADELNLAGSAKDRERAEAEIRSRLAKLSKRLDSLLDAQNELAAKSAVADASDLTGVEVKYSRQRAEAVCRLVSPAQGDSLAAVLTDRMAQSLVNALRSATVAALRQNAAEGGSLRSMSRDILERWNAAATEKPLFTDSAGRTWDTARYIQMNARTNAMRVYNDSLADALAQTGDDLVRVSKGGNPTCDGCFPWEGAILSLTGKTKGFPTYEQARASGCFHPNCTHTLDPVDESADADEIALQREHPPGEPDTDGAFDFDEADERRWEIDVDRKMRDNPALSREAAETAVNRDNLTANIRAGLVRTDAAQLVAQLSDAQVNALCPDGNPPRFAPTKRVHGGTRNNPKYEPERRRNGSRGGSVRIARDTTADHLAQVCHLDSPDPQSQAPKTTSLAHPATLANLAASVESSGKSNGEKITLQPISANTAAEIARLCGSAPKTLTPTVGADEIRHTFIRHGKPAHGKTTGERQKNQLPVTAEDIAKIPEIISAYDRISGGSTEKRRHLPTVRFVKAYRDGTAYSAFVVADTMEFKTMWKRKMKKA